MDKQAVIRRVRIAVSVFFGVLTVAMCVLWATSYSKVLSASFYSPPQNDTTAFAICRSRTG